MFSTSKSATRATRNVGRRAHAVPPDGVALDGDFGTRFAEAASARSERPAVLVFAWPRILVFFTAILGATVPAGLWAGLDFLAAVFAGGACSFTVSTACGMAGLAARGGSRTCAIEGCAVTFALRDVAKRDATVRGFGVFERVM